MYVRRFSLRLHAATDPRLAVRNELVLGDHSGSHAHWRLRFAAGLARQSFLLAQCCHCVSARFENTVYGRATDLSRGNTRYTA